MDRYKPNYILVLVMISMILLIASSITTSDTTELWLIGSSWIVLAIAFILKLITNKKL